MSQRDREKWNEKFAQMPDLLAPRPPSPLVETFYTRAPGRMALDLACGGGRHTRFLAAKGFDVDAVDISSVALERLAQKVDANHVRLIEADLENYTPRSDYYDLIVKTNYLDRALIERAKGALKRGGLFIVETYMEDPENEKRDANPDYLLQREELPKIFEEGFEIVAYETFWNESYEKYRMKKAGIVACRR